MYVKNSKSVELISERKGSAPQTTKTTTQAATAKTHSSMSNAKAASQ